MSEKKARNTVKTTRKQKTILKFFEEKLAKLKKSKEPGECLKDIISETNDSGFDENQFAELTEDEKRFVNRVGRRYYDLLDEMLYVLADEELEETSFYIRLYQSVFDSDLFPKTEKECAVLLFFLARRIELLPYYPTRVDYDILDDEFITIADAIDDEINSAIYVLRRNSLTVKERALRLCKIIDTLEDKKERSVLLGAVLSFLRRSESKVSKNENE